MEAKLLEEIGLTKGEIAVYFALLELGSSTVGPIVDKAKVSSSKVYDILERLIHKGLASYVIRENTKYFEAASPTRILDYLKEKEESINQQSKELEKVMPQLLLKQKMAEKKQEVNIYEGIKGVKTAHEETLQQLKRGEEFYFMGASILSSEKFKDYWQNYHKRREKAGVIAKILFDQDVPQEELDNRNKFKFCEAKYLPISITTPSWVEVFKDITIIGVPSENPISLEIKNKDVAQSFKLYFEALWKQDVKIYKGREGIEFGDNDIIREGKEFVVFGMGRKMTLKHYPDLIKKWVENRMKYKIKGRYLLSGVTEEEKRICYDLPYTELRLLPKEYFSPVTTIVYGNKVSLWVWAEKEFTLMVIENKKLADNYRKNFELMWEAAKQ